MSKLIVLFWTLVLGQVVGYIGLALTNGTYDFMQVAIVSVIMAIIIMIIGEVAVPKKNKADSK
ncbi:YjzD family protein [Vagococcus sp. DIV0080]|uniref:YjzD family protein n=1 Tax=Candidatus Vagococcus giribetii TaxID=2230876 RepID=A0ABS3HSR2_9ENTE|nr:YjzD family protein [Vagococcus sp. DIV0080]MBO0476800.1 YjzD family protein [Vagococcus sp. DIV0080]